MHPCTLHCTALYTRLVLLYSTSVQCSRAVQGRLPAASLGRRRPSEVGLAVGLLAEVVLGDEVLDGQLLVPQVTDLTVRQPDD